MGAHEDHRRTLDRRLDQRLDQLADGARGYLLPRQRAVLDHGHGRGRIDAGPQEPALDMPGSTDAHVDRQHLAGPGEGGPVVLGRAVAGMSGEQGQAAALLALGQSETDGGGTAHGGRDARYDLDRHAGRAQGSQLLAATAEHERVAALETHDVAACRGLAQQDGVDLGLARRRPARGLADHDPIRIAAGAIQDRRRNQPIGHDHVGFLQRAHRLEGEQVRVAGAGTHQRHPANLGRRTGKLALDQVGSTLEIIGEIGPGDRPIEEAVPEPAPCRPLADGSGCALAQAGGPAGEPAQACRQHRLQTRLDLPREDRRGALGADCHDDGVTVDDGRRDEVAELLAVDRVDGHAGRPGHRHRAGSFGLVRERHVGQAHPRQIACRERPRLQRDGAHDGHPGDFVARVLGQHADARLGLGQEPDLLRRLLAAANDQHGLMIQVEEHREEAHPDVQHSSHASKLRYHRSDLDDRISTQRSQVMAENTVVVA